MTDAPNTTFLLAGAALFALGLRGVFAGATPLRQIISVNVMGNGVFLVLITLAARVAGDRPDPVPHAMVLTGIVVAVCATGLALTLAIRHRQEEDGRSGTDSP
jgi:multicomponent Na+:H+ antiporter subunit C